jgi:hypothetical protein
MLERSANQALSSQPSLWPDPTSMMLMLMAWVLLLMTMSLVLVSRLNRRASTPLGQTQRGTESRTCAYQKRSCKKHQHSNNKIPMGGVSSTKRV